MQQNLIQYQLTNFTNLSDKNHNYSVANIFPGTFSNTYNLIRMGTHAITYLVIMVKKVNLNP